MTEPPTGEIRDDGASSFARDLGRRQAEAFDLELRQTEAREREERLTEAAWRPRPSDETRHDEVDSVRVVHLEARISELATYVRAVEDSLPWRLIQNVRRLFGRAW